MQGTETSKTLVLSGNLDQSVSSSITEERKQYLIGSITSNLETFKTRMAQELFIMVASNNGKIDNNENLKNSRESWLNADPEDPANKGRPVISLRATENQAFATIKTLEEAGVPNEEIEKLKKTITDTRKEFESVSSEQGLQTLLTNFLKQRSLEQNPFYIILGKKEGMYEAGQARPFLPAETQALTQKLAHYFNFPVGYKDVFFADRNVVSNAIQPIVFANMKKFFGNEAEDKDRNKVMTLDESKLTPENMEQFGKSLENDLSIYGIASELAKASLKPGEDGKPAAVPSAHFQVIHDSLVTLLTSEQQQQFVSMYNKEPTAINKMLPKSTNIALAKDPAKIYYLQNMIKNPEMHKAVFEILEYSEGKAPEINTVFAQKFNNLYTQLTAGLKPADIEKFLKYYNDIDTKDNVLEMLPRSKDLANNGQKQLYVKHMIADPEAFRRVFFEDATKPKGAWKNLQQRLKPKNINQESVKKNRRRSGICRKNK